MSDILQRAIDKWGKPAQILMAIEECAELQVELSKYLNGRLSDAESVAEEMADVEIMLDQLKLIFGSVEDIKQSKLDRLAGRLNQ